MMTIYSYNKRLVKDFESRREIKSDIRQIVDRNKLLYDHTQFNVAIEILLKILDKWDRFDGIFVQQ